MKQEVILARLKAVLTMFEAAVGMRRVNHSPFTVTVYCQPTYGNPIGGVAHWVDVHWIQTSELGVQIPIVSPSMEFNQDKPG